MINFIKKKWQCPVCGKKQSPEVKFCAYCGVEKRSYHEKYDAFISYRRDGGAEAASVIQMIIENYGKTAFLDVTELQVGRFDEKLLSLIEKSDTFILICSPGCLERCKNKNDWLKREIVNAIKHSKPIIPILLPKFAFPDEETLRLLPEEMKILSQYQAISFNHSDRSSMAKKIIEYMTYGKNQSLPDVNKNQKVTDQPEFKNQIKQPTLNKNTVRKSQSNKNNDNWFSKKNFINNHSTIDSQLIQETSAKEKPKTSNKTWQDPITKMEFVWIPGGCFMMGCGEWAGECYSDAKPAHKVCVDGFWMGKYEVTQGQFKSLMGYNPSYYKFGNYGDNYPVQLGPNEVKEFVSSLNRKSEQNLFRLPTEAEWEYAARSGGKDEIYSGGVKADEAGWHKYNATNTNIWPVGKKAPNGFGLFDMSGNVYEFCKDWYSKDYYKNSPENNPQGPLEGKHAHEIVIRGGSYLDEPKLMKTTSRRSYSHLAPINRGKQCGFRLVRIAE
jgi:formylglycine-generating enzyme required for sulfatase activity